MYEKYKNENNIWETLNYGFPVSKSTTCDPDLERAVKIDAIIKAEELARIEEDIRINERLDIEIEEREKADDVLGNMIAKEVNDRSSADNALDARIKLLEQGGGSGTGYDDTELRNRVSALETSQTTQDGKISVLETDVNALKASQTTQDERIAALEAKEPDLTELEGKVTALETSQTAQDERIAALEAKEPDLTELEGKVTALETSQTTQNDEIEALKQVDSNQATEIAGLNDRITTLEQSGSGGDTLPKVIDTYFTNAAGNSIPAWYIELDDAWILGILGTTNMTANNTTNRQYILQAIPILNNVEDTIIPLVLFSSSYAGSTVNLVAESGIVHITSPSNTTHIVSPCVVRLRKKTI